MPYPKAKTPPTDAVSVRALFARHGDALVGLDVDDIAVHPLVNGPLHSHTGVQAAVLAQHVRAIHVCDNDAPAEDLPTLHASVQRRFAQVPGYRSPALHGLRFRLLFDSGRYSEPIQGVSGLRLYRRSSERRPAAA